MEQIFIVALLVSLCLAACSSNPSVKPLDCNETLSQVELAVDLMNEDRDEGYIIRPIRIEGVFLQESRKSSENIYYLDFDVLETDCPVISGKSWKECQNSIPFHESVFGHCKAIIFMYEPKKFMKLVNYNCTMSTIPPREIVQICPDCPVIVEHITPIIKEKTERLVEKYNKDGNHSHYFKVDEIERVKTQYVFGQFYFIDFSIKETECVKTQTNVNPANCKSLKDHEAHVGFCKGSSYNTPEHPDALDVTCEIYDPRDDKGHHGHRHGHCDQRPGSSKNEGQADSNAPGADRVDVKQEGPGEPGQAPGTGEHDRPRHIPHHRGHKHRCKHGHHPHHRPHHHHHHFGQQNDNHPHHHHHHHHHHNHTSSNEGSSSEEHSDHKPFHKRSKGSIQYHHLTENENKVPVPTIFRLPPPPDHPGKPGKHGKPGNHGPPDPIEFPSTPSPLNTCPGEPLLDLPEIVKKHIFT